MVRQVWSCAIRYIDYARDFQSAIRVGLETGLFLVEDLVGGRISVVDLSRRNHAFAILVKHGPSYFIKLPTNKAMAQSVRNEASIYRLLGQLNPSEAAATFAPRFHEFHESFDALVLEYVPGVVPLLAYEGQKPLKWVARSLGKIIGHFHNVTIVFSETVSSLRNSLSLYEPPAFYILAPSVSMYSKLSPANLRLIEELQENQRLQVQVAAAKDAWHPSCLVHGDLKWDNVLVCPTIAGTNSRTLLIADWELAGVGDPAWDVASIFAAYIGAWIRAEHPLLQTSRKRDNSAPDVSALCRVFWDAYITERRMTDHEAALTLHRTMAYCGMKLIWVAIEGMQESRKLSATYLTHVQVGINILERPGEAAVHLCGLSCEGWPASWLDFSPSTYACPLGE